jgi:dTDP-4-dehydrorhamnose reductase
MRPCIVGSQGQLGAAIAEAFARVGQQVWCADRATEPEWDLRAIAARPSSAKRLIEAIRPDWVILAAAMTNVDGCERDQEAAYAINVDAPWAIARAAHAAGARTLFFSTDYVFRGESGPYTERDEPRPLPLCAYGRTKLYGERAVLGEDPRAVVVRTTTLYGPEARGSNFAYRLAADAKDGRVTRVPSDQVSTPTYNRDLGEFVRKLTSTDQRGILHFAGADRMNRAEFAERLAQAGGFRVRLEPVPTEQLKQLAKRPLSGGLRSDFGASGRGVEDAVRDWIAHPQGRPWP